MRAPARCVDAALAVRQPPAAGVSGAGAASAARAQGGLGAAADPRSEEDPPRDDHRYLAGQGWVLMDPHFRT